MAVMGLSVLSHLVQSLLGEGHDDVLGLLGVNSLGWTVVGMGLAVLRVFTMYWNYRGWKVMMCQARGEWRVLNTGLSLDDEGVRICWSS